MRKLISLFLLLIITACNSGNENNGDFKDWKTPFENGNGNQTATYDEVISFYKDLASDFSTITMDEIGTTDYGKPLHLITFSKKPVKWNKAYPDRIKILINNGIHPGESDGIDATMMLMRDLATGDYKVGDDVIFSAIAVYNIGGAINRNSDSRTNQNGPEAYGFRGNARNYDLNRDFIKADTRNAQAFYEVFHRINPDLFIDNHVSNGADYQYTLTHLFTQHNKLGNAAGDFLYNTIQPELEKRLLERELDITPYVNVWGRSPETGFTQFMDHPRYSTGYTALWNTMGMMVETHMLKPYKDRVTGTKAIMEEMIQIGSSNLEAIKKTRKASFEHYSNSSHYALNHIVNDQKADSLNFKGYEAVNKISDLTGKPLLTYDRNQPFTKKVVYRNHFNPVDSVAIPDYYIIPKGWWRIEDLLRRNNIKIEYLSQDTTLVVNRYRIEDYSSSSNSYEGHFPHRNIELSSEDVELRFRESDIIVSTQQPGIRYLLETLEPLGQDSFFKWNFFDTILQQKEGFSAYVFEQTAKELLQQNPKLAEEFLLKKKTDTTFNASNYAQLEWLHKRSKNYEKAHLNYPIYRLFSK